MSEDHLQRAKRYQQIESEEQAIELARKEGWSEIDIQKQRGYWKTHYNNTGKTIQSLHEQQLRRRAK